MPFGLRKQPKKDLYWVINKETGKKFSKEAMPKERAEAQMRALYANVPDAKGGMILKGRPHEEMWSYDYLNKKGGAKYKWGDIPLYFDDMNGSGVFDTLKNKYKEIKDKGAAFLTGTNYVGPWNRLDEEYIRTHPPTDKIDEGAMKHDLEYSRIAKLRKAGTPKEEIERLIRVSDDAFLDNIKKHWRTNPRAAAMGYAGIKGKNVVEDVAGLDRNLFVGEGKRKRLRGGLSSEMREKLLHYFQGRWVPDNQQSREWNTHQFHRFFEAFLHYMPEDESKIQPWLVERTFNALVGNASVVSHLYNGIRDRNNEMRLMEGLPLEDYAEEEHDEDDWGGDMNETLEQMERQIDRDDEKEQPKGRGKKGRGAAPSAPVDVERTEALLAYDRNTIRRGHQGLPPHDIAEFYAGYISGSTPSVRDLIEPGSEAFQAGYDAYLQRHGMAGYGKAAKKRMMLLKKLEGSGFFGDLWDSGKQFASKVVERVKQTGESVANVFRGKAPRLDLPPKVRQLLGAYGNRPIVRMFVRRDPIQSAIDTALNFISIGSWNSLKQKYGYDTFYHLQLEVIVRVSDSDDTNARFVLQKNEVIDVSPAQPSTDKTEMVEVPMSEGHTMNSLLSNAKQTMGEKFYYYDAFHNNCQDFVGALLSASGLMRPDVAGFIKQPVDQLVKEISITDRIARGITDLGGIVDVGLQGKGGLQPTAAFAAQLKEAGVSPSAYLETAKKKAKALGLAANMLGFSSDEKHKLQIPNAEGKIVRFGAVGLGDYILYTLQKNPEAEKHRKAYLARATKIKGDWAKDPYSANSLAIGVLW